LLESAARSDRGFDAIVVGEYERAFSGGQLHGLLPVLESLGLAGARTQLSGWAGRRDGECRIPVQMLELGRGMAVRITGVGRPPSSAPTRTRI
jgi:hypothetical protein